MERMKTRTRAWVSFVVLSFVISLLSPAMLFEATYAELNWWSGPPKPEKLDVGMPDLPAPAQAAGIFSETAASNRLPVSKHPAVFSPNPPLREGLPLRPFLESDAANADISAAHMARVIDRLRRLRQEVR